MADMFQDRAKAYICMALAAARDEGAYKVSIPNLWGSFLLTKMSWDTYVKAIQSLAETRAIKVADEDILIP